MKFVRTINWTIINLDEVSYIDYETVDHGSKNREHVYPYFHLKNGLKLDAFESPDSFTIEENGQEYEFCCKCCTIYTEILLDAILKSTPGVIFDIESNEDQMWDRFIEWAKEYSHLVKTNR